VFTQLGEPNRTGPRGTQISQCNFALPVSAPAGQFVSGWQQSLTYGVVKPSGVGAGVGLQSRLQEAVNQPPHGVQYALPAIRVDFAAADDLNTPLAIATTDPVTFDPTNAGHLAWRSRWCDAAMAGTPVQYLASAQTWTDRTTDGAEVVIAIDGLDARFDLGAVTDACPPATPR
jgi:hypothetical protein